jgi:5-methylcytosine-specific restriction endonuclease McrA
VNRWNIPDALAREVVDRDRHCVYCGIAFVAEAPARRCTPSWEHIVNDARIVTRENIARCCIGCNASKGTKDLTAWLASKYCRDRGITVQSVAAVVRAALASQAPDITS